METGQTINADGAVVDTLALNAEITGAEYSTILAALRYWQESLDLGGGAIPQHLLDVVTDAGRYEQLTVEQIDALIDALQ